MAHPQALREYPNELHLSSSRLRLWSACSLRYYFRYVAERPPERIPVSLPLGSAVHKALEAYFHERRLGGEPLPVDALATVFEGDFQTRLEQLGCPVVFHKDVPSEGAARLLGRRLLEVFHAEAPRNFEGLTVLETELPLRAPLCDEEGCPTPFDLVGVIDLLLRTPGGELVVVDFKTAARAYTQQTVDADDQLSAYAYLLTATGHVFPSAPITCRLEVLRKLKAPKVEAFVSIRTPAQRNRFARTAVAIGRAIESEVFLPVRSWHCAECPHADACARW